MSKKITVEINGKQKTFKTMRHAVNYAHANAKFYTVYIDGTLFNSAGGFGG